jgi:uncharacterized membrane protein YdjX (TVP38/TMEM64 family)
MKYLRIAIIAFIVLMLAAFFYFTLDNDPQSVLLHSIDEWRQEYLWIVLIIFGITLISTATGLPVLYLGVALGFFLKFLPALAFAWAMNLVAVMLTYLIVNRVFSDHFKEKYGDKKFIKSINKRIKKYGFWTVAFSRSVYIIPTNIINFSFPLSKISAKSYLTGTMIGLIPEVLINVTTGYMIRHEILLLGSPEQNLIKILVIAGFIVVLGLLFIFLRYRKTKLEKSRIAKVVPLPED